MPGSLQAEGLMVGTDENLRDGCIGRLGLNAGGSPALGAR